MLAKYSYQQKLKWIAAAFLLLLFICYQLALKPTLQERQQYIELSEALQQMQNPANYLKQLQTKNNQINQLFTEFALDTLNPIKNLLAVAGSYCNSHTLQLKEYKPIGIEQQEAFSILTRSLVIEGPFIECLGLLYQLETEQKAGRVSSVLFKSYQDMQQKHTRLTCSIFIQNIITNPDK